MLGISGTIRDGPGNKHHLAMVTKVKIDALKTTTKMRKNYAFNYKPATIYSIPKSNKISLAQDHNTKGKMRVFSWCLTKARIDKVRVENDSKVTKIRPLFTKSESSFGKGKTIRHYD